MRSYISHVHKLIFLTQLVKGQRFNMSHNFFTHTQNVNGMLTHACVTSKRLRVHTVICK